MKNINVLTVKNRTLVSAAFRTLLADYSKTFILKEASNEDEALKCVRQEKISVVLIDLKAPNIGSLETVRLLKEEFPEMPVIVVTAVSDNFAYTEKLVQMSIAGFLSKTAPLEELIAAIQCVQAGSYYINWQIMQMLCNFRQKKLLAREKHMKYFSLSALSRRETQVFFLIVKGVKIRDIAQQFMIGSNTVNAFRRRICKKLKARNDVELTHIAIKNDLMNVNGCLFNAAAK